MKITDSAMWNSFIMCLTNGVRFSTPSNHGSIGVDGVDQALQHRPCGFRAATVASMPRFPVKNWVHGKSYFRGAQGCCYWSDLVNHGFSLQETAVREFTEVGIATVSHTLFKRIEA